MNGQKEDSGNAFFILVCLMIAVLFVLPAWYASRAGYINGTLLELAKTQIAVKANQNFLELQAQLEGTENRIAVARKDFNAAAQQYNVSVRRFPANLVARMFGFGQKPYFESAEGAAAAPQVTF